MNETTRSSAEGPQRERPDEAQVRPPSGIERDDRTEPPCCRIVIHPGLEEVRVMVRRAM